MQDHNQEFDLKIRSILEEGELQPRKGVWKNISERLDEREDESRVIPVHRPIYEHPVFRWAGAALSLAVLSIGVFIVAGNRTQEPISRDPLVADKVELIVPEIEKPTTLEENLGISTSQVSTTNTTLATPIIHEGSPETILSEPEQSAIEPESQIETQEKNSVDNPAVVKSEVTESVEPESFSDPFAELVNDDWNNRRKRSKRNSGGVSLYAQGAIGSNDPDYSGRSSVSYLAPSSYNSSGISENSTSTYGIPFTVGLGVRVYLLPRLSLGIGLDYSLLTRTFTGTYSEEGQSENSVSGEVRHTMQYIGVPVELFYDILRSDKLKFYVYGGGEAEYCISNEYTIYDTSLITHTEPVKSLQYSVGGGIGVEFRLMENFGIYFDPGVKYYFPNGHPKSIRTDKPLIFSFDAGLRFRL